MVKPESVDIEVTVDESGIVKIFVSKAVFAKLNERAKANGLTLADYVSSLIQLAGSVDK